MCLQLHSFYYIFTIYMLNYPILHKHGGEICSGQSLKLLSECLRIGWQTKITFATLQWFAKNRNNGITVMLPNKFPGRIGLSNFLSLGFATSLLSLSSVFVISIYLYLDHFTCNPGGHYIFCGWGETPKVPDEELYLECICVTPHP